MTASVAATSASSSARSSPAWAVPPEDQGPPVLAVVDVGHVEDPVELLREEARREVWRRTRRTVALAGDRGGQRVRYQAPRAGHVRLVGRHHLDVAQLEAVPASAGDLDEPPVHMVIRPEVDPAVLAAHVLGDAVVPVGEEVPVRLAQTGQVLDVGGRVGPGRRDEAEGAVPLVLAAVQLVVAEEDIEPRGVRVAVGLGPVLAVGADGGHGVEDERRIGGREHHGLDLGPDRAQVADHVVHVDPQDGPGAVLAAAVHGVVHDRRVHVGTAADLADRRVEPEDRPLPQVVPWHPGATRPRPGRHRCVRDDGAGVQVAGHGHLDLHEAEVDHMVLLGRPGGEGVVPQPALPEQQRHLDRFAGRVGILRGQSEVDGLDDRGCLAPAGRRRRRRGWPTGRRRGEPGEEVPAEHPGGADERRRWHVDLLGAPRVERLGRSVVTVSVGAGQVGQAVDQVPGQVAERRVHVDRSGPGGGRRAGHVRPGAGRTWLRQREHPLERRRRPVALGQVVAEAPDLAEGGDQRRVAELVGHHLAFGHPRRDHDGRHPVPGPVEGEPVLARGVVGGHGGRRRHVVVGATRLVPADEQRGVPHVGVALGRGVAHGRVQAGQELLARVDRGARVDPEVDVLHERVAERRVVVGVPGQQVRLDQCEVRQRAGRRVPLELGEGDEPLVEPLLQPRGVDGPRDRQGARFEHVDLPGPAVRVEPVEDRLGVVVEVPRGGRGVDHESGRCRRRPERAVGERLGGDLAEPVVEHGEPPGDARQHGHLLGRVPLHDLPVLVVGRVLTPQRPVGADVVGHEPVHRRRPGTGGRRIPRGHVVDRGADVPLVDDVVQLGVGVRVLLAGIGIRRVAVRGRAEAHLPRLAAVTGWHGLGPRRDRVREVPAQHPFERRLLLGGVELP